VDPDRFEELVDEAVDSLPEAFASRLDNVDVVAAAWPSRRIRREMGLRGQATLLGLYQGIPQTQRNTQYGNVMPDRILIFREPILDEADAICPPEGTQEDFEDTVRDVVRQTVLHEIGHHFGLSEADLRRIDFG